jgi:phosphate starvation-inducible protein PhoH and related proteins
MTSSTSPHASTPMNGQRSARVQTKLTVSDPQVMVNLLGAGDEILRFIESSLDSDILVRGNEITLSGAAADNALAERVFTELQEMIAKGETLNKDAVRRIVGMLKQGTEERPADVLTLNILSRRGRTIRPKTLGQKKYVDAIDQHTINFGIGPAGTG